MAKKIKHRPQTREEREQAKRAKADEKARQAAGIQDEFQAKGFELADWAQSHQGLVLGALGAVVLAGLIIAGVQWSTATRSADASAMLSEALTTYRAPLGDAPAIVTGQSDDGPSFKDKKDRAEKARSQFQAVVDAHGGTGAGDIARLYVGHTSLTLEDWDGAIAAYQSFLDHTAGDDPLRFAALDGMVTALRAKGDDAAAIARLEELIALPGKVSEDVALVSVAKLYLAAGNRDKAKAAAERVVNDFADSPLKAAAEEVLASATATRENG